MNAYKYAYRLAETAEKLSDIDDGITDNVWTDALYSKWMRPDEWLMHLNYEEFIMFWLFVLEAENGEKK